MATLIKHRNQYLSKIQKWNGIKQVATHIPLRTNKKNVAVVRHHKVESAEKNIKEGIIQKHQFKGYFEWLNDEGTSEITLLNIKEAIEQFIDSHSVNISVESAKRIIISLNRLTDAIKGNTPIAHFNLEHIEDFKKAYKGKHAVAGINLNLRNIKTFLRWCNDRDILKSVPKIKMLREPKRLPKYVSEDNMNRILSLDSVNDFMKRAFILYLTTGCRLSEVIEGKLDGLILIVPASLSKSRIERQVSLTSEQAQVIKEIHIARDTHLLKGYELVTFKNKFTKSFRDACDEISIDVKEAKHSYLHCLRHTYAVTQWIISNDIYEVKNKLGHTSVKTTERYAQFNLDRLAQDFPSAYAIRLEVEKVRKNAINTPLINTPFNQIKESSSNDSNIIADC